MDISELAEMLSTIEVKIKMAANTKADWDDLPATKHSGFVGREDNTAMRVGEIIQTHAGNIEEIRWNLSGWTEYHYIKQERLKQ